MGGGGAGWAPRARWRSTWQPTARRLQAARDTVLDNGVKLATPSGKAAVLAMTGLSVAAVGCCAKREKCRLAFCPQSSPTLDCKSSDFPPGGRWVPLLLLVSCFAGGSTCLDCRVRLVPGSGCIAEGDVDEEIWDFDYPESPHIQECCFSVYFVVLFGPSRSGALKLGHEYFTTRNSSGLTTQTAQFIR